MTAKDAVDTNSSIDKTPLVPHATQAHAEVYAGAGTKPAAHQSAPDASVDATFGTPTIVDGASDKHAESTSSGGDPPHKDSSGGNPWSWGPTETGTEIGGAVGFLAGSPGLEFGLPIVTGAVGAAVGAVVGTVTEGVTQLVNDIF